jgi:Trp operon repressor
MIDNVIIKYIFEREFFFEYFAAFCVLAPWKERRKYWFLILPLYFAVCLGGIDFIPIDITYRYPMVFAILFLVCFGTFKVDFFQALFYAVDAYALQFAASCFSFISIPAIDKLFPAYDVLYYTHVTVSMLLFFVLGYFFIARRRKGKAVQLYHIRITLSSLLGIGIFVFLSTIYKRDMARFWMKAPAQNVVMLMFTFAGLGIMLFNDLNTRQKKMEEDQKILELMLKKDEMQYEQTKALIERINIREHDLRHQQECRELSQEEQEELEEISSTNIARFATGNASIDIVLSEQAYICHKKDIQLLCNINGQLLSFMKSTHIASLFTNALNNAVNYLDKVQDKEKKIIRVSLQGNKDNIILAFQNYLEEQVETENNLPKTTAKEKELHGFGLKSIQNIVSMYDGYLNISQENNTFTLIINFSEPPSPMIESLTKGLTSENNA